MSGEVVRGKTHGSHPLAEQFVIAGFFRFHFDVIFRWGVPDHVSAQRIDTHRGQGSFGSGEIQNHAKFAVECFSQHHFLGLIARFGEFQRSVFNPSIQ